MDNNIESNNHIEPRVFPFDEPKGTTLAYASVAVDNFAAIRGIRVIEGSKGRFVAMPQSRDKGGNYRDLAYPLHKELRDIINDAILKEYERRLVTPKDQRRYPKWETDNAGRSIDVDVSARVFLIKEPKADTLAFASVGLNDTLIIRGIRVIKEENGESVSMPQSKDKDGNFRDLAFPLSQELRSKITKMVLAEYKEQLTKYRQSIEGRLAEGMEMASQMPQPAPPPPEIDENSPGLED